MRAMKHDIMQYDVMKYDIMNNGVMKFSLLLYFFICKLTTYILLISICDQSRQKNLSGPDKFFCLAIKYN